MEVSRTDSRPTFETIYRQHLASLKNIVWRYVNNPADADDLLQEAAVKAFTNWDRFDPAIAKFTTWFSVIVRNCAIDEYRKTLVRPIVGVDQRTMEGVMDPEFGQDPYSSENHAVRSFAYVRPAQAARDALAWLPADQREVVELESQDVSHRQMEEKLGQPLGTIKSRMRMARVKLRRTLESRGITAETLFGT